MNNLTKIITSITLITTALTHADSTNQLYASIDGGVFQAHFNSSYLDQTDIIPQNISGPLLQDGYTGGLAIGYSHVTHSNYFFGLALSGHLDSNVALYQSGAANTAFSNEIKIRNHLDLTVVPGILIRSSLSPYLKLGVSYASIHDNVISPVGYTPVMTSYYTNKQAYGFVAGLGLKQQINEHFGLFTEANYHDYGTLNMLDFQNFTADYSHSARLCSYGLVVGAAYSFNV